MRMLKHLPCAATLGNLAAGVVACALAARGRPEVGALLLLAAVLLDSLDGALARTLSSTSEFGAELDSLADVVSFGVAPAVLAGSLLPAELSTVGWLLILAFPLCAAWRLARFNLSTGHGEHGEFAGLPSTGAGAAAATAIMLHFRLQEIGFLGTEALLPWALLVLAVLMVSRVPYRHAGHVVGRLHPVLVVALAAAFILGSVFWHHEYLFAALTWGYAVAPPLHVAGEKIRAVRHA
jgi:CDP-diacylglycerol--serine O-phosphatidyltransferase